MSLRCRFGFHKRGRFLRRMSFFPHMDVFECARCGETFARTDPNRLERR